MPEVKKEITHHRDLRLNNLHRSFGWDCPVTDIDFLEYDNGKAVAIFECKKENAPTCYPSNFSRRALVDLGTRAGIPVFGLRHSMDINWFVITPLNPCARKYLPTQTGKLSQNQYKAFLYLLRDRRVEDCNANLRISQQSGS